MHSTEMNYKSKQPEREDFLYKQFNNNILKLYLILHQQIIVNGQGVEKEIKVC